VALVDSALFFIRDELSISNLPQFVAQLSKPLPPPHTDQLMSWTCRAGKQQHPEEYGTKGTLSPTVTICPTLNIKEKLRWSHYLRLSPKFHIDLLRGFFSLRHHSSYYSRAIPTYYFRDRIELFVCLPDVRKIWQTH
jgi:hypothetical protein